MKYLVTIAFCLLAKISFTQNTGVGTITPQEKLHIAGSFRADGDVKAYQSGFIQDRLTVGTAVVDPTCKLKVVGGKTWTGALSVGGEGFIDKMLSVYGDAQITGNTNVQSLKVINDGIVSGNIALHGRIGIAGATHGSYGLIVNNANSYFEGDAITTGNARINGRIGIGGPTNPNYGLIVNNASSYLQGNLTVNNDGLINGNARVNGRMGINGGTSASYGLLVNNANTYMQGNTTISGDLTVLGTATMNGNGNVTSNGSSSLRISFNTLHVNQVLFGNDDSYSTFSIPEFGSSVSDIRISIFQYIDGYNDQLYSNPQDFHCWISDVDPVNNTARVRMRNLAVGSRALRGDFYFLIIIRD